MFRLSKEIQIFSDANEKFKDSFLVNFGLEIYFRLKNIFSPEL